MYRLENLFEWRFKLNEDQERQSSTQIVFVFCKVVRPFSYRYIYLHIWCFLGLCIPFSFLLPVHPRLTSLRTSLFLFFSARNFSTSDEFIASCHRTFISWNKLFLSLSHSESDDAAGLYREEFPSASFCFLCFLFSLSTSSSSMPLQFSEFRRIFSPQNKWRKTSEQHPCFTQIVLRMVVRVWYNIESTTTNFSHHEHHFLRKNTTRSDLNTDCWIPIIIFETADLKVPNTVLEEDSVIVVASLTDDASITILRLWKNFVASKRYRFLFHKVFLMQYLFL